MYANFMSKASAFSYSLETVSLQCVFVFMNRRKTSVSQYLSLVPIKSPHAKRGNRKQKDVNVILN